jgi:hypothetical protein
VFPIQEGRYVIGPMVRIFWGSPPIITADIAILIEVPSPIRIVLLGQISALLPKPTKVLVELHLDILGVLEFDKKSLAIDATIWGYIKSYPLSGDAALRVAWGENPQFAMSLGGFHPRFSPPPNFPDLRRLKLELSSSSSLEISCSCYNALTSGSLQFGARVDFYGSESGASLEGKLSFDALIYFSPFHFDIDMGADVVARYRGHRVASVSLALALSGPTPWHAKGKASFSILWWDVTARFNKTWGSDDQVRIAAMDPWLPLQEELARSASWTAALPPGRQMVESLRSIEIVVPAGTEPPLLLHPLGTLEVRQKLLPLEFKLDTLGNAPVKDHSKFWIKSISTLDDADDATPLAIQPRKDFFARGQFEDLSDSQRLSVPSFEKMNAGVGASLEGPEMCGERQDCPLEYESILINEQKIAVPAPDGPVPADWEAANRAVSSSASRRNRPGLKGRGRFGSRQRKSKVGVSEEGYTIVKAANLVPAEDIIDAPRTNDGSLTRMEADQTLDAYLAEHPELVGTLQVVCASEAAEPEPSGVPA